MLAKQVEEADRQVAVVVHTSSAQPSAREEVRHRECVSEVRGTGHRVCNVNSCRLRQIR